MPLRDDLPQTESVAGSAPRPPAPPFSAAHSGWLRAFVASAALLAAIGAAYVWASQSEFVNPRPELRIAINPWPGYEFATVARDMGFFESAGVRVRLVEFNSLGDCRRAFERGQVDGFFSTTIEVIQARVLSSRRPQIVLVTDYSDGADVVLAKPPCRTVAELQGKRVGVEECSLNEYLLARALELAGLTPDAVTVRNFPVWELGPALRDGRVDAVVAYPPLSLEIQRAGSARPVFTSRQIPGEVLDVVSFDQPTIRSRSREIAAFVTAFLHAQDFAAERPDEASAIMAARSGVSAEELQRLLDAGVRLVRRKEQREFIGSPRRMQELMERTAAVLRRAGHLDGSADLTDVVVDMGVR